MDFFRSHLFNSNHTQLLKKHSYCIVLFFLLLAVNSSAQDKTAPAFEPVPIEVQYPLIGDTTMVSLIFQNQIWLPVEDLFHFLQVKKIVSEEGKLIQGFIFYPDSIYQINYALNTISFGTKTSFINTNEWVYYQNKIYLQSNLFSPLFSIDCRFDYRALQVIVQSKYELPIVLAQKQRMFRKNINKLKNVVVVDSLIKGKYQPLNIGVADWTINQVININGRPELQANLAFGGSVLGGEMNAAFQYNNKSVFDNRQQYYLWRHVNNDNKYIKQVGLGKINTNAIASLFAPVVGVRISNTPTIQKADFGNYRIDRFTEPNWTVELYINNLLVNYTKADAAGFYSFEIPVLYGNSQIMLRQYGPNGEQKTNEFNINIPYNFLPKSKVEYIVNAGFVEDTLASRFSKLQLNYGLTNRITIGAGVEYLSSIGTRKDMPYVQANFKIANQFLMTAQYIQDVKFTISGNFRAKKNVTIDALYSRYKEGQQAIFNNYLEERNLTFSVPWRFKKNQYYSRLNIYQIVLPAANYTTIEAMVSGRLLGTGFNISNFAILTESNQPYLYTNFSFSYTLKNGFLLSPIFQYEFNTGRFISSRIQLDKLISQKTFLNFFYDHNYKSNIQSYNLGIRYDLKFMQAGYNFRTNSAANTSIINYLRGSLLYERKTKYTGYFSRPGMGRSGMIVYSFLDYNGNGKKDPTEPKVNGLKFSLPGGSKDWNEKDTSFVIRNLEPYYKYIITVDKNSFDEIAWRLNKSIIQVHLIPNQFTPIAIPIEVLGEVSGTVSLVKGQHSVPLGRIVVEIINAKGELQAKTLSDETGYYNYLGLPPGVYMVKAATMQLEKLGYRTPISWPIFTISETMHGDSKTDINLVFVSE